MSDFDLDSLLTEPLPQSLPPATADAPLEFPAAEEQPQPQLVAAVDMLDFLGSPMVSIAPPPPPLAGATLASSSDTTSIDTDPPADALAMAQKAMVEARREMGSLETELNLLWIKNPATPDEAMHHLARIETEFAALQTEDERNAFVKQWAEIRGIYRANVLEYRAVEKQSRDNEKIYFDAKDRVELLEKHRALTVKKLDDAAATAAAENAAAEAILAALRGAAGDVK